MLLPQFLPPVQGNRILPHGCPTVTPAEAGVQCHSLESGFRQNEDATLTSTDFLADFVYSTVFNRMRLACPPVLMGR
jgi:hypothetical protein